MMKTITRLKKIEHSNQTMRKYKANIPHENLWQWLWIIRTDETKQNPYAKQRKKDRMIKHNEKIYDKKSKE